MFKAMLVKEFRLVGRDKQALAALFIMPAIFILIMSMALKDTFNSERALVDYAVVDLDETAESVALGNFLAADKGLHRYEITAATSAERQSALREELDFVVEIPAGFTEKILNSPAAKPIPLKIYAAADIKKEMLKLFQTKLLSGVQLLRLENLRKELRPLLSAAALNLAATKFAGFAMPAKEIVTVHFNGQPEGLRPTSTQQSVPSWIVFGMFFVIIPLSTIFISERRQNTLLRMRAMHVSTPVLLAGKIIPYMVINQLQVWLMIGVGMFVVPLFGADALTLGRSLSGLFMVSFGLSLTAVGTAILIAVSVETVEQATTIGGIINILLGAIGGVMVPKFYMPEVMQSLARLSPMSWGLDGFLDIFLRGLGPIEVLPEFLQLVSLGGFLLLLAGVVFERNLKV
jgi:ABC-2 type transport system permease protein